MVPTGGVEPPTSPLPRVRSNLLSHVGNYALENIDTPDRISRDQNDINKKQLQFATLQ